MSEQAQQHTQKSKRPPPPPPRFYVADLKPESDPAWFKDDQLIPLAWPCEKARLSVFQASAVLEIAGGGTTATFAARKGVKREVARRAVKGASNRMQGLSDFRLRKSAYWKALLACWSNRAEEFGAEPLVGLLPYVDPDNASSPEAAMRLLGDSANYRTVTMRGRVVTAHELPVGDEAYLVETSADLHNG